jgi:hypothetical protein
LTCAKIIENMEKLVHLLQSKKGKFDHGKLSFLAAGTADGLSKLKKSDTLIR